MSLQIWELTQEVNEVHGCFGCRYDKETGTGGSNGATMRFSPEGDHGANAGLKAARDFLEPIKGKPPYLTPGGVLN